MNSTSRRLAISGTLLAGGIALGSLFTPLGLAGAQDDTTTTTQDGTTTTDDSTAAEAGRGGHGHGGRGGFGGEVLEGLGIDLDALRTAIEGGSTLAEAAAAQGVSEADLAAALTTAANERIDQALADGRIDETEAAEKRAEVEAKVAERLASTELGGRGGHGGGGRGHHDDDATTESSTTESSTTGDTADTSTGTA